MKPGGIMSGKFPAGKSFAPILILHGKILVLFSWEWKRYGPERSAIFDSVLHLTGLCV